MKFTKTDEVQRCPVHGDGILVTVDPGLSAPPTSTFKVCYRCLNDAIEQYQEPLFCADCGIPTRKGYGLEKNGKLIPLCPTHQGTRLFGGTHAELGRADQPDEGSER